MTRTHHILEGQIDHDGYETAYIEAGDGPPIVLIHGSGPGVTAAANWQGTLRSSLSERFRLIAPDVAGFGGTTTPEGFPLDHDTRVSHLLGFLDAMGLERVRLVGNSMGGGLALAIAHRAPARIERMVLMGSVGIAFPITPELDQVWGYEPSRDAMAAIVDLFAFDDNLVGPELVDQRYAASILPNNQERYAAAFPAPRQDHVDAMALSEQELRSVDTPTLLIHGAHDRIIPLEQTSLRLAQVLPNADLMVLGRCGHWTQIERAATFQEQLMSFFTAGLRS